MRSKNSNNGLTVQAIAGTHNIILGIDLEPAHRAGCLGFSIQRTKLTNLKPGEQPSHWLYNSFAFKDAPALPDGSPPRTSDQSPWQSFRYNDLSTQPATQYTYTVIAQYGPWNQLQPGAQAAVTVTTENPANPETALFFNRAAAASEAYYRTFGQFSPDQIQDPGLQKKAYDWLSNGLEQAVLDYLSLAADQNYSLHAAIYEFQKNSLLQGLKAALGRGVDVQVVYHHRQPPTPGAKQAAADASTSGDDSGGGTASDNDAQIAKNGLNGKAKNGQPICIPRSSNPQGAIMHNKFVVLLQNGQPIAVWTGSTNWTDGGLYGQLNLGIAVHDSSTAKAYEAYWQALSHDPSASDSKKNAGQLAPITSIDLAGIRPGYTALFSPQPTSSQMLKLYGQVCAKAPFLLVCAPFELAGDIIEPLKNPHPGRGAFLLLDKEGSLGHDPKATINTQSGDPNPTPKTMGSFSTIQNNPGTLISVAATLAGPLLDYQKRILEHVESFHHAGIHIHSKIIASDPLGPDPILIIGSANYSNGSTFTNDENSLIIRGKPALMDICVSEFMRVFDTYRFRYEHKNDKLGFAESLAEDDSWSTPFYSAGSALAIGRQYFAGTA